MAHSFSLKTPLVDAVRDYLLDQLQEIRGQCSILLSESGAAGPIGGQLEGKDESHADAVHDLRVAVRRCQSIALATSSYIPKRWLLQIKSALPPFRKACDRVRDLDVLLAWLRSLPDSALIAADLLAVLEEKRQEAASALHAVLLHETRDKTIKHLTVMLKKPIHDIPWQIADVAAAILLERAAMITVYHQILDVCQGPLERSNALHKLRITGKHFRYVLELLLPALPDEAHDLYKQFESFQDCLGGLHDCIRLSVLLNEAADWTSLAPDTIEKLDSALERKKDTFWLAFQDQWKRMTPRWFANEVLRVLGHEGGE